MTTGQRTHYFGLWKTACAAQGWSTKDEARRRAVTAECMACVRGPAVSSSNDLGEDEITALYCYLEFLSAGDADLDASARWLDCQQDYKAFNRAKQADWHEEKAYGKGRNKLDRNRFKGEASAVGGPLEKFDPEAIKKRHLTMASRHQKKAKTAGLPRPKAANTRDTAAFPIGNTGAPAAAAKRTTRPITPPVAAPAEDVPF